MKKANFNTLKNLPVPEKWLENALAVPEKESKMPPVPLFRRRAAAAAAIVLVSALSIALFFSIRNAPVTVEPFAEESSAPSEAAVSPSQPTESVPVSDGVEPSQGAGGTEPVSAIVPGAYSETQPNAAAASEPAPTQPVQPTQNVSQPTEPTRPSAPPQTEPPRPTEVPAPTEPMKPTETPAPTEPEKPPTEPCLEPIWDDPTEPPGTYYIAASIPWDVHPGRDHNVFCRLETFDGEIIGEGGLFDGNRKMLFIGSDRQKNIYCYQFKNNITIPDRLKGEDISYYIYDIEGNILKSGSCRL